MKRPASLSFLIIFLCCIVIGVGATLAYIVATTPPVVNTFSVGDVKLSLTETSGNTFKLAPGVTLKKDPLLTVKGGSLDCWVFIKVEASSDLHLYASYEIDETWIDLEGEAGVYYLKHKQSLSDSAYPIIKDNKVTVFEDVTEEDLSFIHINPTLKFKAYAVQADSNINNPDVAWDTVILEKGE